MADLQLFTAGVLERKEQEFSQAFEAIKAQEDERLASALERLANQESAEKAKLVAQFDLERSTALQRIENQKRNALLTARQERLLSVFDKAYETMASWDKETFSAFLHNILEKLDKTKNYTLVLGERSQYDLVLPNHVSLSEKRIPREAGFMLETDGISYNYLFKSLLDDIAPELLGRLSKQLKG